MPTSITRVMKKMIRTSTNTTTTTFDGTAIDGSDDPLTPTKLMISDSNSTAELSPFHDVASTPSSSQKKTTTYDGDNNAIVQDRPVSSAVIDIDALAESALGLSKLDGKKSKRGLYRVLFGCMFAYVVLGIWIYTIIKFIVVINKYGCVGSYEAEQEGDDSDLSECIRMFTGKLACAHTITFGLISAVVIQETGSSDDTARQRLSSIAKPILKRRQAKNANIFQRALLSVIVLLPAVYVVLWTVFGLWCFIYSIAAPDGSSGPLFYTGEVWLGITIRASYTVFGVSESASPSKESGHSQRAQQNVYVDEETGLLQKN